MRIKVRAGPQTISSAAVLRAVLAAAVIAAFVLTSPRAALAQAPPTPNANQFGLNLIGAPAAWALGYSGVGVTVAVTDSGIDPNHPAFAGKIDARSRNFRLPSANAPYVATQLTDLDTGGHGTHVAGIVAAAASSTEPGVAYSANLVVLRAIGGAAAAQFPNASASALDYFAGLQNVLVYNASYGPDYSDPPNQNLKVWPAASIDKDEAQSAQNALANGKIVVAATGNDRGNNPVAGLNPSGIALYPFVQPTNANAGVYLDGGNNYNFSALQQQPGLIIAVTAVGQAKTIASYAQYCGVTASWCVAAPGGDQPNDTGIFSTLPGGNYGALSGTSMAAPMVSGALAVLQQAYPTYSARDLANVLFATAENVGGQAADNATYGYGMIRLDRATAGPTTLAAGSNVAVAAQQTTYWSQPLTTAGGFTTTGPGYLIVAGRTTAAGDVAVNGGALGVDGTLTLQTRMTVAQGAMLAGFGNIVGNVTINGTLNAGQLPNYADLIANNGGTLPAGIPLTGTSPGTLTFQGNVTLAATATTRDNIDGALQIPGGPGTYDKINITGAGSSFAANGVLTPILRGIPGGTNTYIPPIGTIFPFVTAQNGAVITGQFASLTQPASGLAANSRFDVVYLPTSITLNVTPLNFQNLAAAQNLNANQQAVATVLDTVRPQAGLAPRSTQATIFNDLYDEDTAGDDAALGSLSGQGQAAMPAAVMNAFSGLSDVIGDHQATTLTGGASIQAAFTPSIAFAYAGRGASAEARAAGIPFPQARPMASAGYGQWTTWGQAYGRWSNVGTANGLPGYVSNSGGFVVGTDRMASSDLVAGGALGYTRTSTSSADTKGTTDTYAGAVYASWTPGSFVFDGRLAAGATATGTSRSIVFPGLATPTATGSVNGWGGLVAGEAGYRFNVSGLMLKPYVGLTGQILKQNAFTETTDFGLSFPAQTFTKVTTAVGTLAATTFQSGRVMFMPQAKVAWLHALHDDTLTTQAALFEVPFAINAADPGRDAALLGLQVAAWRTQALRVFAAYTGEFRSNATSHQLAGGLRAIW